MLKIGITGGIGTGKTTVCRIFETLGIPVFYADEESKKILFTDQAVMNELRKIFGDEIFSGQVPDRKKIASIVFSDTHKLHQLNSILHPATYRSYSSWAATKKNPGYSLMEAALIFETGGEKFLDKIIVVSAPEELRIRRTMERDHLSEEEVKARMNHQLPQAGIEQKADFIILNDEQELLIPQVMEIHEKLILSSGR